MVHSFRVHRAAPPRSLLALCVCAAGKSTLSRLLARADAEAQGASGELSVLGARLGREATAGDGGGGGAAAAHAAPLWPRAAVGWVSTELHLSVARAAVPAWSILLRRADREAGSGDGDGGAGSGAPLSLGAADEALGSHVAHALGLDGSLLARPFDQLSQGEQKLVLLGVAIARQPALLVLDEPCQGLDLISRRRVLELVERVCRTHATTLVYITHHYEECVPCVSHVMHLRDGQAAFAGERAAYEQQMEALHASARTA